MKIFQTGKEGWNFQKQSKVQKILQPDQEKRCQAVGGSDEEGNVWEGLPLPHDQKIPQSTGHCSTERYWCPLSMDMSMENHL